LKSYKNILVPTLSILFLVAGIFWIWHFRIPENEDLVSQKPAPQVGFQSPPFDLMTLEGTQFELSEINDTPIIINFWASWCPPCRAEMEDFQIAYQEFADEGLVIAAINATNQDSLQDVNNFVEAYQLTFPILMDTNGSVLQSYNVHSLPTTYFVDRHGNITNVFVGGPIPLSLLRVEINKLLRD
jgi:peroxiredoxin